MLLVGAAIAIAILGSLAHNAIEFGIGSVLVSQNGELPLAFPWIAGFLTWWRIPQARIPAAWFLIALAGLNLIGGGIITVLPLGFLPFEPEQSLTHYLAHLIYGVAQLPVLAVLLREVTGPATAPRQA
ncbi:MAG: hypothetical protein EA415_00405 [Sphaerobacteraceae bacterium]|nr:MAG: hypothetical protein EA415_00405 [Sphaerobacteraceae bacterium]